jgi:hypothetical protein
LSHLSGLELNKLKAAWLAWKDITSPEFLETFRPLWDQAISDVETLLKQCDLKLEMRDFPRVGLTLQPNVSFAFSPIPEGCFINVWSFLFCHGKDQALFRSPFFLAHELVHEHAHLEFWRDHGMLGKDKEAKEQFDSDHGIEDERHAFTKEAKFLEKMLPLVPDSINTKYFLVTSWNDSGVPICKVEWAESFVKVLLETRIYILNQATREYASKKEYSTEMSSANDTALMELSSILNLSIPKTPWQIVEIR